MARTFPNSLRILAYADIHHGERSNGRTQSDMVEAEDLITQYAIDNNVDWVVFAGDAFKSRNPHDECKTRWLDCRLRRTDAFAKLCHGTGRAIHQLDVVGNHCRWYKADHSGHVFEALELAERLVENTGVLRHVISDTAKCFVHNREPGRPAVAFYTLPAQVTDTKDWWMSLEDDDSCIRVCVAHGMVKGCALNQAGTVKAAEGIPLEMLDREEFDFVILGDIHIAQQLPFKNTRGGYVGSTLQLDDADRGEDRGFIILDFVQGESAPQVQFIPIPHARIERVTWDTSCPLPDCTPFAGSLLTIEILNTNSMPPEAVDQALEAVRPLVRKLTLIPRAVASATVDRDQTILAADPRTEFSQYLDVIGIEAARRDHLLHALSEFIGEA